MWAYWLGLLEALKSPFSEMSPDRGQGLHVEPLTETTSVWKTLWTYSEALGLGLTPGWVFL